MEEVDVVVIVVGSGERNVVGRKERRGQGGTWRGVLGVRAVVGR